MERRAFITLALSAAALAGCAGPSTAAQEAADYNAAHKYTPSAAAAELEKIPVAPGTVSVFFGDSWTAGYSAAPSSQGFAYKAGEALGWSNKVEGLSGTGYLNAGSKNQDAYAARMSRLAVRPEVQVLVLQGGLNDESLDRTALRQAAAETLSLAHEKFPSAKIVLMGPASPSVPASPELVSVNSILTELAASEGLHYISPLQEHWINPDNQWDVIDKETAHPSTAGHAYLGEKVVTALRAIGA